MAAESIALNAWLYGRLSSDATLATALATLAATVYAGQSVPAVTWSQQWYPGAAPAGAPRAFGLWQWIFTPDVQGMGAERIEVHPRLRAYVVAACPNWEALQPVADRLDALLHAITDATAAIRIGTCYRISEYSRLDDLQGVRWLSLGGLYAVQARSLTL